VRNVSNTPPVRGTALAVQPDPATAARESALAGLRVIDPIQIQAGPMAAPTQPVQVVR